MAQSRSRSDRVRKAIASPSTCTHTTVSLLQQLLAKSDDSGTDPGQERNSKMVKSTSKAKATTRSKPGPLKAAKPVRVLSDEPKPLNSQEKLILATETVNLALKSLSECLKQSPKPVPTQSNLPKECSAESKVPSSTHHTHNRSLSHSSSTAQPLKPRSVNSPDKIRTICSRASSSSSSPTDQGVSSGIVATAECARIAFAHLRAQNKTVNSEDRDWQLENGMLAFIGKSVAHGLDSIALKELRILKSRLSVDDSLKPLAIANKRRPKGSTESTLAQNQVITDLIIFSIPLERDSQLLPLITAHQIYVIKLIAARRKAAEIESLAVHLDPAVSYSPINLLTTQAQNKALASKSVRQLESLSHTLLSLCPSVASSDDAIAGDTQKSPSPEGVFRLQYLAFQARLLWWKLSGHKPVVEREFWSPLSRCFSALHRRCTTNPKERHLLAKSIFTNLESLVKSFQPAENGASQLSKGSILKTLSSTAQAAGYLEEAIQWTKDTNSIFQASTASEAKLASSSIRLKSLIIASAKSNEVNPALEEAIECLKGSLKGDSSDLDGLLLEIAGFRRSVTKAYLQQKESSAKSSDLISLFSTAIFTCVRFLLRYLGTRPEDGKDAKTLTRYAQRVEMATRVASGFVDSAILACKAGLNSSSLEWEVLDDTLQDCSMLLTELESQTSNREDSNNQPSYDPQLTFVKISSLYFNFYTQAFKPAASLDSCRLKSLRRSIEVLKNRGQAERGAGLYAIKLDKLSDAYLKTHNFQKSYDCLCEAIREYIRNGVLQSITDLASSHSLQSLWDSEGPPSLLSRLLRNLHAVMAQASLDGANDLPPFDHDDLSTEGRGIIQEYQLQLHVEQLLKAIRRTDTDLKSRTCVLIRNLLEIYDSEIYPIRRLRVLLTSTRLMCQYHDMYDSDLLKILEKRMSPLRTVGKDEGLERFREYLETSIMIHRILQEAPVNTSRLHDYLVSLQSLVDNAGSKFSERIDNVNDLIRQLNLIADFLDVQGLHHLKIPTMCLINRVLEYQESENVTEVVTNLSNLALHYLYIGYSGKAGVVLAKSRPLLSESIAIEVRITWHLVYSEYLLAIGAVDKCGESLATVESLADASPDLADMKKPTTLLSARMKLNKLLAHAFYVVSMFQLEVGASESALLYAKYSTKLYQRIWAVLENGSAEKLFNSSSTTDSEVDSVSRDMDRLKTENIKGGPVVLRATHEVLNGPVFWSLVPALSRSYYNLSKVLAHHGLFPESVYWIEQAQKITDAVPSSTSTMRNCSALAEAWIQSGDVEKGQEFLDRAVASSEGLGPCWELLMHNSSVAMMWRSRAETSDEIETYDTAIDTIGKLVDPLRISGLDRFTSKEDGLASKMSKLSVEDESALSKSSRTKKPKKTTTKVPAKTSRKVTSSKPAISTPDSTLECVPLQSLQGNILRNKAAVLVVQGRVAEAEILIQQSESLQIGQKAMVEQKISAFGAMFCQSMKVMSGDFTFSVLPESTITVPALSQHEIMSSENPASGTSVQTPSQKTRSKSSPVKKTIKTKVQPTKQDFRISLRNARDCLAEVNHGVFQICSTFTVNRLYSLLAVASTMLSAASLSNGKAMVHPLPTALLLDLPKNHAAKRELSAALIDGTPTSRDDIYAWPTVQSTPNSAQTSTTEFQCDYIDIIPETWTAVSITLNDAKDELFLSRYRAGQSPFIIRLPLTRHKDEGLDEDTFGYEEGKAELREIVELSNITAHQARDLTSRGSKQDWWTEREALDRRLQELVTNVENIWLGGFRGVFSQHLCQPLLLARFQKALQSSLNRHLPSRQGRGQSKPLNLDPRILELFIGLGDPREDGVDLDESLMDLLYFVVDILQFTGEKNAYDEIDFDSIVIEMTDALKSYYSASISSDSASSQHTILILDKNLHGFPWESLPCLSDLNISRLPSMESLRTRILQASSSSSSEPGFSRLDGHIISCSAPNSSLLNPSGDLSQTQAILEPLLHSLPPSWKHSSTAPGESTLCDDLSSSSLFLYFGHGSGAQFARNRAIKRLSHCPTTWLMGCSSSAINTYGEFEPSGMVLSYLTAGAPAIVGALWDVTDRDCDRAAVRTGEMWGLWEAGAEEEKLLKVKAMPRKRDAQKGRGGRNLGKRAVRGEESYKTTSKRNGVDAERKISLVEAVRRGRDECYLKYLNGAALVVYGIPVYLDQ